MARGRRSSVWAFRRGFLAALVAAGVLVCGSCGAVGAGGAGGAGGESTTTSPDPPRAAPWPGDDGLAAAFVPGGSAGGARRLGFGRHPLAVAGSDVVFATTSSDPAHARSRVGSEVTIVRVGLAAPHPFTVVSVSTSADLAANPVVGALGDGRLVVAWTERDDEATSVRLGLVEGTRLVTSSRVGGVGAHDPDLVVDAAGTISVVWIEDAAPSGPDVWRSTFVAASEELVPSAAPRPVADTPGAESAGILGSPSTIGWTERILDRTRLHVRDGDLEWESEPYVDGPSTSRPALVALEGRWLAVFVAARTDDDDDVLGYELRASVLDREHPGVVASRPLDVGALGDPRDPTLVLLRESDRLVVAFGAGDEVFSCPLAWGDELATIGCREPPRRLPSPVAAPPLGARRRPVLLEVTQNEGDFALLAAWDEHGRTFGDDVAPLDVAFVISAP